MTGLQAVAPTWDSVDFGPVSERVDRIERLIAHAQDKRVEAAQRVSVARRARENAARERADTERWLGEVRADRQARRRDAADRAGPLLDAGVADSVSAGRRRRLMFFDADFCMVSDPASITTALLDAAIALGRADRGNIQLFDPDRGGLRIAAQQGFESEFLNFFDVVDDDRSACGMALAQLRTVQVEDVTRAAVFDGGPARDVVLGAGVRAVRSIPLVDDELGLIGVMSVHYGRPHRPAQVEQNILAVVAAAGARRLAHPPR